jgi:chromosome segregation ATPase
MSGESKPRTKAERLADFEAEISKLKHKIGELEDRIVELSDEVDELKSDIGNREADNADRAAIQLGAYRAILADLDALFGLKRLPFAVQASLAAFGEML